MSQVQINKLYIRQHVGPTHQSAFYAYFTQLSDFDQFQNWTHERTVQVVRDFQASMGSNIEKGGRDTIKIQISPNPSQTLTNNLDVKNFQTYSQGLKRNQNKPTVAKNISALNLLEEIEQQMIFTPRKKGLKPIDEHKNNIVGFKTSTTSERKTQELIHSKVEQPQNSRALIKEQFKKSPYKQQLQKKISLQSKQSAIKGQQKFQLKRSYGLKRQKSDLRQSSVVELKQKKSSNSDKLFRWKLNQQIPCRKLVANRQIKGISITNHEMVHRYFLPDYAIYHILVIPGNHLCKRTYDEFLDLRKNLTKLFPCVKIPYLDSSSWFSESDIALINKNKINLELFINELIRHPTLAKAEIVCDFLTIPGVQEIETALNNYADLPPISKLSELANQQGIIKVSLSEQNNKLIGQLPLWQKYYESYFDKYIDLISNLTSQYESIQLIFSQLVTLNYDFRVKMAQLPEARYIVGNFGQFQALVQKKQQYFNCKSKQVQKDIDNLKDKYSMSLKYQKLNVNSFESIVQPVQKLAKRYIERLQNEPQSPSSGLQTYNITVRNEKFTQTIWQESQNINLFKYQVGYLSCRLLQQLHIFSQQLVSNLTDIWEQVFDKPKLSSQDLII